MSKRALMFGFCALLGVWYGVAPASSEQGTVELEKPIRDQQFAQSPAAATVTTGSIQPRQTKEREASQREVIGEADSWVRWPSLTDF